jgi:hypothetical protein
MQPHFRLSKSALIVTVRKRSYLHRDRSAGPYSSAELLALRLSARRQRRFQLFQDHAQIRPREGGIGNVGRKQREPQDAAYVVVRCSPGSERPVTAVLGCLFPGSRKRRHFGG